MVENGSSGGAWALPPNGSHHDSHDKFLELCAIATTGSLSAEERGRLEEHLPGCAKCRETLAQYEAVIGEAIPAMAPERSLLKDRADNFSDWSPDQVDHAESALFARLKDEEPLRSEPRKARDATGEVLWRHMWWQYAAGLLLTAVLGGALYRVGIRHGVESAKLAPSLTPPSEGGAIQARLSQPDIQGQRDTEHVRQDGEIAALQEQLEDRSSEIAKLKMQQFQMEKELSDRGANQTRFAEEQAEATRQLQLARGNLEITQRRLDAAVAAQTQEAARTEALAAKVNQLSDTLRGRDRELAREQELLDHDRDIRELMGERDLYVAEVYDVAKTGDTQKPFGRVFYSKGKSLTVYAFDLDQQPGIKDTSTFQAWGRRGPDQNQAVNLGVLFQDNASKKRWRLKSNNAKTLSDIDAVFVTVEPNGGSKHPSSKPFLFAYLKIEPNHP
jgi:anti-sigma factor RsiW